MTIKSDTDTRSLLRDEHETTYPFSPSPFMERGVGGEICGQIISDRFLNHSILEPSVKSLSGIVTGLYRNFHFFDVKSNNYGKSTRRVLSSTKRRPHIVMVAGEPSGDLHGADVVRALYRLDASLSITGIGGDLMAGEGMDLIFHLRHLSAMGITEVIRQLGTIRRAFSLFRHHIIRHPPDLVILIDYPGFNLKAAQLCHERSIPVLYYILPKVWAWHRSRLKKIKRYVDHAALIFPFEEAIYRQAEIPATFVGNPLIEQIHGKHSNSSLPKGFHAEGKDITIGLLPGSRLSEIKSLLNTILEAALAIHGRYPHVHFLLSRALVIHKDKSAIQLFDEIVSRPIFQKLRGRIDLVTGSAAPLFVRSDFLIAASGTVTLEAALHGIPMVIVYKVSPLTAFFARSLLKLSHVGLPNIVAGYDVVPELIQGDAKSDNIADKVLSILKNPETMALMKLRLGMLKGNLGERCASRTVARMALRMMHPIN